MKNRICCLMLMCAAFMVSSCGGNGDGSHTLTGWAVGWSVDESTKMQTVKILKTSDAGTTWILQTVPAECDGLHGNDISAVNDQVAWAAVGGLNTSNSEGGILHTADAGETWRLQTLPDGIGTQQIKSIKGMSPTEAWAVSIEGDVLHTTDGGVTWQIVPVRTTTGEIITMTQVNRMDVTGQDIWIVDVKAGELGVIHSPDGGLTWRRESLSGIHTLGPLSISAFNSLTAWAAVNSDGHLWWTSNGGQSWNKSNDGISGTMDFDDISASSTNVIWIAVNGDGSSGGFTARVTVTDGNFESNIHAHSPYMMEGVSPLTDNKAWAVGCRTSFIRPDLPMSAIYLTEDSGVTWQSQTIPDNARDVVLWKVSFVGARR